MLKGIYWDQILTAEGKTIHYGWRDNMIVNQCRQLLASFMKGSSASGIQFIALGRGDPAWDLEAPAAPTMNTSSLTDPAAETISISDAEMSIDFVDATGAITTIPSERIQVSVSILGSNLPISGDETFPLREFGLFGHLAPSDFMIDYVRHPVIHIGTGDTLLRKVKLIF